MRAANDLAFARAVVDATERKFVRARMFVARDDLRHDDAIECAGDFLHALDFEAEHGEPFDRLFDGPVENNVLLEPV